MKREIKFRVWNEVEKKYFIPFIGARIDLGLTYYETHIKCAYPEQFTGLKDKNGKDIYEGDIITFCKPIRTTQTHEGDNIPNGSYTEPMEPGIQHFEGEVKFKDGCFFFEDYDDDSRDSYPLAWNIEQWDEESIKEAISYGKPDRFLWDDPEEGDMQYLLEENNLTELQQLIDYLSGVKIIGNIHENPKLL